MSLDQDTLHVCAILCPRLRPCTRYTFILQIKFGVSPPLQTQHHHFLRLFSHGKKNLFLLQLPVCWRHFPGAILYSFCFTAILLPAFCTMYMWPLFHPHSVYPTQSLIGLPSISVTDPAVCIFFSPIHSSRIFLNAHSILDLFWYKNSGHSLFPTTSSLISSPWTLRISTTPPLQPFPNPTTSLFPCSPGHPFSSFQSNFSSVPHDFLV